MTLTFLRKYKDNNQRIFRWSLFLQEYNFDVEYIKGESNFSDVLSRNLQCNSHVKEKRIKRERVIPDEEDFVEIIKQYHDLTGHGGEDVVKFHVLQKYKWKGANSMINRFIKSCEICQMNKKSKRAVEIYPMRIYSPNKRWELDLIGPLNSSGEHILTCMDVFSRYGMTRILRNKSAVGVTNALEDIFEEEGIPREILTDNGKEFCNRFFLDLLNKHNIQLKHGSPYTPTTSGAIERFNQTLISKLKKITKNGKLEWKKMLSLATDAYNHSPCRAHKFTPFIFKGKTSHCKIDDKYKVVEEKIEKSDLEDIAIRNIKNYQKRYERKLGNQKPFKIGESVWFKDLNDSKGKFDSIWQNKGTIVEVGFGCCKIRKENGKILLVNKRRLKRVDVF